MSKARLAKLVEDAKRAVHRRPEGPRAIPDDWAWAYQRLVPAAQKAVQATYGGTFGGAPIPLIVWLLTRWARSPSGIEWVTRTVPLEQPVFYGRSEPLFHAMLMMVKDMLERRARCAYGGQMEPAIQEALYEMAEVLGFNPGGGRDV